MAADTRSTTPAASARPAWTIATIPWHPALLVFVIILAFWMDAVVSPFAAFRSFAIGIVGATVLTVLPGLLLRNRHAGGVAATAIIGVLYTKHVVRLVVALMPQMPLPVLMLWLLAMVIAVVLVVRMVLRIARRLDWTEATWLLNRLALLLVFASLLTGLLNGKLGRFVADLHQGPGLATGQHAAREAALPPDIYVVLLDGYPRQDVLKAAFDYDNTPFITALEQRRFTLSNHAHSDYLWTHLSLPSLLHMSYIEGIKPMQESIAGTRPLHPGLYDTVNHNPTFDFAHTHGYQTVGVGAGFEQLAPRLADVYLDAGEMNEYEIKLLNSTWLGQVVSFVAPTFASAQQADRIRTTLGYLDQVATAPHSQPRLVLAHVPSPHQPTVFRSDGSVLPVPIDDFFYSDSPLEKGIPHDQFVAQYRDHLTYLNGLVLDAVDRVIADSSRPPVIILWSDHGSASRVDWLTTEPEDAPPDELLERTGTLLAALTPGKTNVYPDDPSPASVMRYLFDAYFGTHFGRAVPPPGGGQVTPLDPSVLEP